MKQTMKMLLALLMVLALLPLVSVTALSEVPLTSYVNAKGVAQTPVECIMLGSCEYVTLDSGWYAVTGSVKVSGGSGGTPSVTISGDVNLILCDGAYLETANGIYVPVDSSLTIWAQSTGDSMGRLNALSKVNSFSDGRNAGIGGIKDKVAGTIIINGGNITCYVSDGAGIGGGNGDDSGYTSIRINGGRILAYGGGVGSYGAAAGIGAGKDNETNGKITITGGIVDARGSRRYPAIGTKGSGGEVVITGGKVEATSRYTAASFENEKGGCGIASQSITISADTAAEGDYVKATGLCGYSGIHGTKITITGGHIEATVVGEEEAGAGISVPGGNSGASITISGGTVIATGGEGAGIGTKRREHLEGTIRISGGTVNATSWDTGAGIGAGHGGNAKEGHIIITGGTVTAKGGTKAAGIGAGSEYNAYFRGLGGEGCGDVQILGGTVFAQSGGGSSSAIGHGDDDEYLGNITFGDGMMVKAGWTEDECNSSTPFSSDLREEACKYRYVAHISECSHPDANFLSITHDVHLQAPCPYCGMSFNEEHHIMDGTVTRCTVCGYPYDGKFVNIHFDADGGTGTMADASYIPESIYTLPECGFTAPEDLRFGGWLVTTEGGGSQDPVSGVHFPGNQILLSGGITRMTLKANWVGSKPITFEANGGTGSMDPAARYEGEEYPLPPCDFTEPEWYYFAGWQVNNDTASLKQPLETIIIEGDTVITAIWKRTEHTVTFVANNGSDSSAVTVANGDPVPRPDDPVREGYAFKGWLLDGEMYQFNLPVTADMTLAALWDLPWTYLQYEINTVDNGSTITLTQDVIAGTGDEAITVPEDKIVTIDLDGHTISRNLQSAQYYGCVFRVDGNLTVTDSGDSGAITGSWNISNGGGVFVDKGGTFTLKSGTIRGNRVENYSSGGGVYVENGGTFIMNGGAITGGNVNSGNAFRGGGVYTNGTFTMNGGAIRDNKAIYGGGVQLGSGSTFTMTGGTIGGNEAEYAGAVLVEEDGTFAMNGGTISGNHSNAFGMVYMDQGGALRLSGSPVITDNDGGNVFLRRAMVINIAGPLTDSACVGVTMEQPGVFTKGLNGSSVTASFFADSSELFIFLANGELGLTDQPTLGTPDFTLPDDITRIEEYAFQDVGAHIVYIPDRCTEIGRYAFKDCASLRQIRIPAGCAIGEFAFDGCKNLYVFSTPNSAAEQYCANHDNCTFVEEAP